MGTIRDQIRKAIGMHGLWKQRLASAIESGQCDLTPAAASADDQCEFGRWLHRCGTDPAVRDSAQYRECRDRHAEFHVAAGTALGQALRGERGVALDSLHHGGAFAQASAALTVAMMSWQKTAE